MAATAHKKLFTVNGPEKLVVYRCRFRPLESNKYLSVDALSAAVKATIEIGTVDTPYGTWRIVAEIKKGMITALKPLGCEGCAPKRKTSQAKYKKALTEAAYRVAPLDKHRITLPMPLKKASIKNIGLGIVIGPIIILGPGNPTNPRPGCIYIWGPGGACWICDGFTCCVTPTDPHP